MVESKTREVLSDVDLDALAYQYEQNPSALFSKHVAASLRELQRARADLSTKQEGEDDGEYMEGCRDGLCDDNPAPPSLPTPHSVRSQLEEAAKYARLLVADGRKIYTADKMHFLTPHGLEVLVNAALIPLPAPPVKEK